MSILNLFGDLRADDTEASPVERSLRHLAHAAVAAALGVVGWLALAIYCAGFAVAQVAQYRSAENKLRSATDAATDALKVSLGSALAYCQFGGDWHLWNWPAAAIAVGTIIVIYITTRLEASA